MTGANTTNLIVNNPTETTLTNAKLFLEFIDPTGTVVRAAELLPFIDKVPPDCLVVLDEAYAEYARDPQAADGLSIYRDRPNVALLRTFSKIAVSLEKFAKRNGRKA